MWTFLHGKNRNEKKENQQEHDEWRVCSVETHAMFLAAYPYAAAARIICHTVWVKCIRQGGKSEALYNEKKAAGPAVRADDRQTAAALSENFSVDSRNLNFLPLATLFGGRTMYSDVRRIKTGFPAAVFSF